MYFDDAAIDLQIPDVPSSHRGEGQDRKVQFVDEAGTSATSVRYGDRWEADAVTSWGPAHRPLRPHSGPVRNAHLAGRP
ncbi:hypothetical protein [Streptomyces sp. NPDC054901]